MYLMKVVGGGDRVEKLRLVGAGLQGTSVLGWTFVPILALGLRPELMFCLSCSPVS